MKWELNTVQNADVNCSTKLLLNTVKSQPFATGWLFWSLAYKKCLLKNWVIKLFEGLPKFMRVSREGLALLECQFLRV